MNSLDLKKTAEDLIDTFLEAGKIAKEISHKGVEILIKPDNSPVTNGYLAVDKLLQTKIKSFNPNIPIIVLCPFCSLSYILRELSNINFITYLFLS